MMLNATFNKISAISW